MKQYLVVATPHGASADEIAQALNTAAKLGWSLHTVAGDDGVQTLHYMEREVDAHGFLAGMDEEAR